MWKIHWMSKDKFYRCYNSLKQRCSNKKLPEYPNYWWRWIKCERNSFEQFKEDMYESYLWHQRLYPWRETSLDRIDVDWNYSKDNCRWATIKEQQNNKTNNILYKNKTVEYWAKRFWIKKNLMTWRLHRMEFDGTNYFYMSHHHWREWRKIILWPAISSD
jgi:hypothetical protein